ncbi:Stabilizer of axonemal microtubules 2 [Nymphon striatum]|nr:Stabilizer of axonemal microtubules 2 [Nymphon striatum]
MDSSPSLQTRSRRCSSRSMSKFDVENSVQGVSNVDNKVSNIYEAQYKEVNSYSKGHELESSISKRPGSTGGEINEQMKQVDVSKSNYKKWHSNRAGKFSRTKETQDNETENGDIEMPSQGTYKSQNGGRPIKSDQIAIADLKASESEGFVKINKSNLEKTNEGTTKNFRLKDSNDATKISTESSLKGKNENEMIARSEGNYRSEITENVYKVNQRKKWTSDSTENITSNKMDYQQWELGERRTKFMPEGELKVGVGQFEGTSVQKGDYTGKFSERPKAVRPKSEHKWKSESMENVTSNKMDYQEWEMGDRQTKFKPEGELKVGEGQFEGTSVQKGDYTGVLSERPKAVRPKTEHKWKSDSMENVTSNKMDYQEWEMGERRNKIKPEGGLKVGEGQFEGTSVQKGDYTGKLSDRPKAVRPKTAHKWKAGSLENLTSNKMDYQQWEMGERRNKIKPEGELKVGEGQFEGTSVQKGDYTGKLSERPKAVRPKSEHNWKSESMENVTSNKMDYQQWELRDRQTKFKPEGELKVGEGQFGGTSVQKGDYTGVLSERPKAVRPKTEHKWKAGSIENLTSNKIDYQEWEMGERRNKIKPESGLKVGEGQFEGTSVQKGDYTGELVDRQKAVRPKTEHKWKSGSKENATSNKMDYQQWEMGERRNKIKPEGELKVGEGQFEGTSVHKGDYTGIVSERPKAVRPKTAHKWKSGSMENVTSNKMDYQQWEMGERRDKIKPDGELKVGEGQFEGTSVQNSDYTGELVDRQKAVRPKTEHKWKSGSMENVTSNKMDYQQWEMGERRNKIKPDGELKVGEGQFEGTSVQKGDYTGELVDRTKAVRPKTEHKWKSGSIENATSNKMDYQQWEMGERRNKIKPEGELKVGEGQFEGTSVQKGDYTGELSDRPKAVRPKTEHKWKSGSMENVTSNKMDYQQWEMGERRNKIKPDGELKVGEGQFEGTSVQKGDYTGELVDRTKAVRPKTEHKWKSGINRKCDIKQDGLPAMGNGRKNVQKGDYTGELSDRPKAVRPKTEHKWKSGSMENVTSNKMDYQQWEMGERRNKIKPDGELKVGEGQFEGTSVQKGDYTGELVDRTKAVRPKTEHKWKSGSIENATSNKMDYQQWEMGERRNKIKPEGELKVGEGQFEGTSVQKGDYTGIVSERPKAVRPKTAHKWKSGSMENVTSNKMDYQQWEMGERRDKIKPDGELKVGEGQFEGTSVQKGDYTGELSDRPKAVRPKTEHKWKSGSMENVTSNKMDYQQWEMGERRNKIKPDGELKVGEGQFEGTSVQKGDYTGELVDRTKAVRPKTEHKWKSGSIENATSNKMDYQQWEMGERRNKIKPEGELKVGEGQFEGTSVQKGDYTGELSDRPKAVRPKTEHKWKSGSMENVTSNKMDYQQWEMGERRNKIKPDGELKVGEGQFVGTSVQKGDYTGELSDKPKAVRPKTEHKWKSGSMENVTSNKMDYQQWEMGERRNKIKPDGELKVGEGQFEGTSVQKGDYTGELVDRTKAVRPKTEHKWKSGSIENATSNKMDYQQWEMGERRNKIKPEGELKVGEGQFEGTSVQKGDYTGIVSERPKAVRPKTAHKWKSGSMENVTSNKMDYQQWEMGERRNKIKPDGELKVGEGQFEGTSVQKGDYTGIVSERPKAVRPKTAHKWKSGSMENVTSNKMDYQQWEMGERRNKIKPDGELKVGEGQFEGTSVQKGDYTGELSDRPKAVRPKTEHKWKSGSIENATSNKMDYQQWEMGERRNKIKPEGELKVGEGQFEGTSVQKGDYTGIVSERPKAVRPKTAHKWKSGSMENVTSNKMDYQQWEMGERRNKIKPDGELKVGEGQFEGTSVQKGDYTGIVSERPKAVRPKTAHKWKSGSMENVTSNKMDYQQWEMGERRNKIKPDGELKVGEGQFEGTSVQKGDYTGELSDRPKAVRPKTEHKWKSGSIENATSNKMDYQQWEMGERRNKIKPEGELKVGEGQFEGTSVQKGDYTGALSERSKAVRPKTEHKWKSGSIENATSNKMDYQQWEMGERRNKIKPEGELKVGEGQFEGTSVQKGDYTGALSERSKAVRPKTEHKWKSGSIENATSNKMDYQQWEMGERRNKIKPEGELKVGEGQFEGTSVQKGDYTGALSERSKAVRPKTEHKWKSGSIENATSNKMDYQQWEMGERRNKIKPEGELKVGEGQFEGTSVQKGDYTGALSERSKAVRPKTEHKWKSGSIENATSNKMDYQQWEMGERRNKIKPEGELKVGEGQFEGTSVQKGDYTGELSDRPKGSSSKNRT